MNDKYYMKKCFELAKKGRGKVLTNPLVGAVLVKDEKIISSGYHKGYGMNHAEVDCFNNLKEDPKDSTLYVNLEPCSHYGKQGPCTKEIIKRKIKKVVISNVDTNPKVSGIKELEKNGIEVVNGILEEEGLKLNEKFFFNMKYQRPLVALKYAQSLDGKVNTKTNDSKWISNEFSREYVHKLRSSYDAIIVGKDTLLHDNPSLNSRIDGGIDPIRVIVDSKLSIKDKFQKYKVFNISSAKKTYIATTQTNYDKGLNTIKCGAKNNEVNLLDLINKLYEMNVGSVLVEGGPTLNYSFLKEGLVDKIYEFIAPILISGYDAKTAFYGEGVDEIMDAYKFKIEKVKKFDTDLMVEANNVYWNI